MDIVPFKTEPNQLLVAEKLNRDEYPIIWYEPDIDSEEKICIQENSEIKLFSKIEDAFKAAQSLGSFLLITPVDEEKLFEDFRALEDTQGKRYFDFEEEAVLKSLFKEISEDRIKSLKVNLFCTREDFLKEIPISEEEEVVIKCDLKEIAEQFREEFTILWCDPDSSPERKEALIHKLDIEEKNIYTDFEELLKKLNDYNGLPYHLILSGKTKYETITEKIGDFKDLLCVYIYDSPSDLLNKPKSKKIKIEKTLEGLIPRIIEGVRTNLKYKNTFPAFATQFDDWDKSHINRMHYYLRGLRNFKNRRQAKGDFVELAKRIYQSKRLFEFEKEYAEYNKGQILKWYAEQSPVYKLVNNCLRIATSDSITYCRFVLKDLERAIKEDFQQQSKKFNGVVYRGAYISKEEFEKLERNVGKEIEMYGFLSTSMKKEVAENFMYEDLKNKVLISIIISPLPSPELDEQGFADLRNFSGFSEEEEILFNVRSRFQVLEAGRIELGKNKNIECRHLVLLYGAQLLRQYMERENPRVSLSFELPVEFQCNHCKSKENLFACLEETGKTQMICGGCMVRSDFGSKSTFLLPIDEKVELDEQRRIKKEVSGKVLDFGMEAKLTHAKTNKCHQCSKFDGDFYKWINLKDGNIKLDCFACFKKTQESKINDLLLLERGAEVFWGKQGRWNQIERFWEKYDFHHVETHYGVDIFVKAYDNVKCQEFCRKFLQNSVRKMGREEMKGVLYYSLWRSREKLGEPKNIIENFLKALEIRKSFYGEAHQQTATSYKNLAVVYDSLGEYQKALEYHLKALDIRKSIEANPDTVSSLDQLVIVCNKLRKHQKALEYSQEALEIRKDLYGEAHLETTKSYNSIASAYYTLGDYKKALDYLQVALEIRKFIYGEVHPDTAASHNNIATVYFSLGEHRKAFEYYLKVAEILKSIYGEAHPETATSLHNLAIAYHHLGEYQKALEYSLKVLEIRKSMNGESHPETVASYENLATVYSSLGEHKKARESLKAVEIYKSVSEGAYPITAISLSNLGIVYSNLGEYQKALEYHLEALNIQKSVLGEAHPSAITTFNNLGSAYFSLGKHQEAFEYHLKALNLAESIYEKAHQEKALSYNNIGTAYLRLGDNQKALEYLLKALETQESIYGEKNSKNANVSHNIAQVLNNLEDYQNALKFSLKAVSIQVSIHGENHSMTALYVSSLGFIYSNLGDYQKALEFCMQALTIQKEIFGETHPEMAVSYNNLGEVLLGLKDYSKALEYFSKALDIKRPIFGDTHPEVATLYERQIMIYVMSEDDLEDKKYLLMIPGVLQALQIPSKPKSSTEEKVDESSQAHLEKMEDSKASNLLEKRRLISDLVEKIKASRASLQSKKDEENVEPHIEKKPE